MAVMATLSLHLRTVAVLGYHRLEGMCDFSVQWQWFFSDCEKNRVGLQQIKFGGAKRGYSGDRCIPSLNDPMLQPIYPYPHI